MSSPRAQVTLRPFTTEALDTVSPWFDDAETLRWLGGRDWAADLLGLIANPPREHRGSKVRERSGWVASSGGEDVALVDAEIYDDGSAAVALVVSPQRRRQGLGSATLVEIGVHFARTRGVTRLVGGVEQTNVVSAQCVRAAGFIARTDMPDEEGFIAYELLVAPPH